MPPPVHPSPDTNPPLAPLKRPHVGLRRLSVQHFLIALVLLILTEPFVERMPHGRIIESIIVVVVLFSAVLAVGAGRRNLLYGLLLLVPVFAGRLANHHLPHIFPREAALIPGLFFTIFVEFNLLRFILRAPRVTSEVLCAGVAAYLLVGIVWAFAYMSIADYDPAAFIGTTNAATPPAMAGFNSLYYSFITLNTVGYGDFVPNSPLAKLLAVVESTVGVMFMALLIARLVSLYNSNAAKKE